ncbi:MAG: hypothetical protein Ct9H90mP9_0260 [Pseudomonadota bacterium]|nr:MAG: hypothetical protein Ct9H90mP9_0260 [Pseudomonadota bacterium]
MNQLDARISELSEKYLPPAVEMLKEVIRIPADYVDKNPRTREEIRNAD